MPTPSSPTQRRWRTQLILVGVAALALPAGAAVLYHYSPNESTFYPPCMFNVATGLHCPGCGATRCLHALLHGDLAQAFAYNPLLVLALPLLAISLLQNVYGWCTGRRGPMPMLPGWSIHVIWCVLLSFWVLRNIPVHPLTLLAPHKLQDATPDGS